MGLIKEPKNIDFFVIEKNWSEKELKEFSELIKKQKNLKQLKNLNNSQNKRVYL